MAGPRVRIWWLMSQGSEAPLFRTLSRKWRSVDQRERRMTPFALALPGADTAVKPRGEKQKNRMELLAESLKKSKATWNPWRMTK
jgi:hypothetical protein